MFAVQLRCSESAARHYGQSREWHYYHCWTEKDGEECDEFVADPAEATGFGTEAEAVEIMEKLVGLPENARVVSLPMAGRLVNRVNGRRDGETLAVRACVDPEGRFLQIQIEGYGEHGAADGAGAPVLLEYHEGILRLIYFPDVNSGEAVTASLEGARESLRLEQVEGDRAGESPP